MVIYFTGTGNSKYLAQLIAEGTGDSITDAAALIRQGQHPAFASEAPYVFVAPTYAWRLPRVFEAWMRKCRFAGSRKAYFVLSCGSDIGAAARYAGHLCDELGFSHMGTAEIVMPENYIAIFSAPDKEEAAEIIVKATEACGPLVGSIMAGQPLSPVRVTPIGRLCSGIVNDCFYKFTISAKKFRVTQACISCGQCAAHCMLNNITIKDGKPVWGKDCTHCMACICRCPVEAIEYGRHTVGLRRYVCPEK